MSNQSNNLDEIESLKKLIMKQEDEISRLTSILRNVPGDVYWKNLDGVWLGLNNTASENLKKMGFLWKSEDVIGKNDVELFGKETAEKFRKNDLEVLEKDIEIIEEETAVIPSGEKIIQLSTKRPLKDKDGKVVGIIGTTINITSEKEAEQLKLENAAQQTLINQQKLELKSAEQLAHDMRSPLATLMMQLKEGSEDPERMRITVREAVNQVTDMLNSYLDDKKNNLEKAGGENPDNKRQEALISALLLQVKTNKRMEYAHKNVEFDDRISPLGYFAFLRIEPGSLKRSLSNLINNAVDAFEGKPGKVTLNLDANPEWVTLTIEDNGKGMPPAVIEKIMNNLAVTQGKTNGHGIGLTQVREMLERNHGELSITSEIGKGTKVFVKFPCIRTPIWAAESICLQSNNLLLILDDDKSIHGAWDSRFEKLLKVHPGIQIKHFSQGQEALDFIKGLSPEDKKRVFLLTDYELLKQNFNGIQVIEQGGVEASILVTSHYADTDIQKSAIQVGTKILAKELAPEVSITVLNKIAAEVKAVLEVDLILVEDDPILADSVKSLFHEKNIVSFPHPKRLLAKLSQYPKYTPIGIDNSFGGSGDEGIEFAKQLHELGYTRLYLFSGKAHFDQPIPEYLTILPKSSSHATLKKVWFGE